jgi:probable rRNA maturation factor
MSATIELVNTSGVRVIPLRRQFKAWVEAVISVMELTTRHRVAIKVVDSTESAELNAYYRHKNYATNVLSFPVPVGFAAGGHLGDLALCASVVIEEANTQHKNPNDHWAHLVVHGVLHLLGYDHEVPKDAKKMEALEVRILANLDIKNPYIHNPIQNPHN